jgi:hypothetical protein
MLLWNIDNIILNKFKNEDEPWIQIVPYKGEQNIREWTILCCSQELLNKENIEATQWKND